MKCVTFYLILILVLASCEQTGKKNMTQCIKVNVDDTSLLEIEDFYLTDTINLETTTESLIGVISRISFINDSILVADFINHKLSLFSPDGRFLTNIGKKGQGLGEYVSIHDYFIKDNIIHVYDFYRNVILKYSLSSQYLGEYSVPVAFDRVAYLPLQGYILLNTFNNRENNPKFSWLDSDFNLNSFSTEQRENGTSIPNMFYAHDQRVIYWEFMNNTIYSFTGNQITPQYTIDFGEYNIPENLKDANEKVEYYSKNYSHSAGFINNVIETETILAFTFVHNLYTYWIVCNKIDETQQLFQLAKNGEYDKLT